MKKLFQTSLCLLLMIMICVQPLSAQAETGDESVAVSIPVIAEGGDCTAELLDEDGNQLQTLALKDGVEDSFSLTCQGLGKHSYSIRLADVDSDTVSYDKTVYHLCDCDCADRGRRNGHEAGEVLLYQYPSASDADPDADPGADARADPHADACAHSAAGSHAGSHADARAHSTAGSHADSYAEADRPADGRR